MSDPNSDTKMANEGALRRRSLIGQIDPADGIIRYEIAEAFFPFFSLKLARDYTSTWGGLYQIRAIAPAEWPAEFYGGFRVADPIHSNYGLE